MTADATPPFVDGLPEGQSGLSLWLASLVGQYQLRKIVKGGLPQTLRPPFLFLLNRKLSSGDQHVVRKIERLRSELAKRENELVGVFLGTRSIPTDAEHPLQANSPQGQMKLRSLKYVAHVSSVLPQWGVFLRLCANATRAKTILELGSSAGISGCYLASGKDCQRFITIEGCPELAQLAETHLRQTTNNFEVLNASFTDGLDRILPTLNGGIDMAYIDGSKDKLINLDCFDRVTPYLNPGSVVVIDDIHWSSEMWEAWKAIRERKGLSFAINAGRFGVCLWSGGATQPKTYDLYKVIGVDLYRIKQSIENIKERPPIQGSLNKTRWETRGRYSRS
jgi:predicted O-methyltransferase YrrM